MVIFLVRNLLFRSVVVVFIGCGFSVNAMYFGTDYLDDSGLFAEVCPPASSKNCGDQASIQESSSDDDEFIKTSSLLLQDKKVLTELSELLPDEGDGDVQHTGSKRQRSKYKQSSGRRKRKHRRVRPFDGELPLETKMLLKAYCEYLSSQTKHSSFVAYRSRAKGFLIANNTHKIGGDGYNKDQYGKSLFKYLQMSQEGTTSRDKTPTTSSYSLNAFTSFLSQYRSDKGLRGPYPLVKFNMSRKKKCYLEWVSAKAMPKLRVYQKRLT